LRLELAFTLVVQNAIIKGVSPHRGGWVKAYFNRTPKILSD
jgi:hypothetical protein